MKKIIISIILIVSSVSSFEPIIQIVCKPGMHQSVVFSGKFVKDNKTGEHTYIVDKGRPITKCVKDKTKLSEKE